MKHSPIPILLALLSGCATPALQSPRVSHVEFGGPIWAEGQRRGGALFQDGGQSFPIPVGSLWTFGDTFVGRPDAGQTPSRFVKISGSRSTTIAVLPAGQTNLPPQLNYFVDASGTVATPWDYLPGETAEHNRIWPLDGISLGPRIYLYYTLIEVTDAPGPWNFHGVGAGLGVADGPLRHFVRVQPGGNWRFPVAPSQVVQRGNQLYLFEISDQPKGLILARVKAAEIENPAAYQFLTDQGWSPNRAGVRVILKEAYGQISIVWLPASRTWLMATSSDFFHPQEIQLRQSPNLEGPWSAPVRIAVPPFPGKKTQIVYCSFLHPELGDPASGRMVLTFCRILEGDWELSNPEWMVFIAR